MKPRCPNCQSLLVYFRSKTDDFLCRSCGQAFTKDQVTNVPEPETDKGSAGAA